MERMVEDSYPDVHPGMKVAADTKWTLAVIE
jgi:hypothetical protein